MSKTRNLSDLLDSNGDVKVGALDNAPNPVAVQATTPSSASEGDLWYDSSTGNKVLKYYDGTDWFKVSSEVAVLNTVSGAVLANLGTTLTLSGTGFLSSNLVVNFEQPTDGINVDVTVAPTSDTSASVSVPSSVYSNVTAGNVVSIKVTNSDGMQSGSISKTAAALPTGGVISTNGNYRVHRFTSSGTFTLPTGFPTTNIEYVVVGGGGGGGTAGSGVGGSSGGGGGGGYRSSISGESSGGGTSAETPLSLNNGSYTVTVGAGGGDESTGSNSVFATITSLGGGYGGNYGSNNNTGGDRAGGSGGSGGGGCSQDGAPQSGGSGTSGQGYSGGNGGWDNANYSWIGGGGGGGAAGVGGNATQPSPNGGNGGAGITTNAASTPYYLSEGGAGGSLIGTPTNGVAKNNTGSSGAANSGRGGSGTSDDTAPNNFVGGSGGSGVVIVRYDVTSL